MSFSRPIQYQRPRTARAHSYSGFNLSRPFEDQRSRCVFPHLQPETAVAHAHGEEFAGATPKQAPDVHFSPQTLLHVVEEIRNLGEVISP
jgi:hypothetical protein